MHVFRDNAGRTWPVEINVTAARHVKALVGVNLYGLVDGKFEGLGELLGDPIDLCNVLYVLCKPEADRLGVSDEEFGRGLAGDALGAATDAFLDELVDFFPDPRTREGLREMIAKGRAAMGLLQDRALVKLRAIDPAAVALTLNGRSGDWPDSSGSTPDPSP